jgi:hypothetical protein
MESEGLAARAAQPDRRGGQGWHRDADGLVDSYVKKWAAEEAAPGVSAVDNRVTIRP